MIDQSISIRTFFPGAVGNQAVGVTPPVEALADLAEQIEEHPPIVVAAIDVLAPVAPVT